MIQWFSVPSCIHIVVLLGLSSLPALQQLIYFLSLFHFFWTFHIKTKSPTVWPLMSGFFHLAQRFRVSARLSRESDLYVSLRLNGIPLEMPHFVLSSYPLMDIWVVSTLSLLRCRGHWGTCAVTCFQFANSVLNFSKNHQTVFHGGCTISPSSQRFRRAKVCGPLIICQYPCVRG